MDMNLPIITFRLGPHWNSTSVYCMKLINFNLLMEPACENLMASLVSSSSSSSSADEYLFFFLSAISFKNFQVNFTASTFIPNDPKITSKTDWSVVFGLNSLLGWLGAHEVTFLTWKMSLDITMKVGLLNKFLSNGGH